jgi:hypothetical protein
MESAIGAYMQFPKTGLILGLPRILPYIDEHH